MKLLGISTSTNILSLCLTDGDILLSKISSDEKRSHAKNIIPKLDELFNNTNLQLKELDGIAVNIGPGSFTGLRIGLSTAKGLVFGSNINFFAYSSFEEFINQAICFNGLKGRINVVLDSRKNEFYFASFITKQKDFSLIDSYELVNLDELSRRAENSDYTVIDSNSRFLDELELRIENIMKLKSDALYGCMLVNKDSKKYFIEDYDFLEPMYLKDFIPKINKGLT